MLTALAVEQAIHGALKEALQAISTQHGIQVTSLNVEWLDVSAYGSPAFKIRELRAETFSRT